MVPAIRQCRPSGFLIAGLLFFTAAPTRGDVGSEAIVVGNHANVFDAIDFLNPSTGVAQQFTIDSGDWDITRVLIRLGNQALTDPIDPVVQIRDDAGGSPGSNILGSFVIDGSQIPLWSFGSNNTAIVQAAPQAPFVLDPDTYWLAVINPEPFNNVLSCYTSNAPLIQSGVAGTIDNAAAIYRTTDGGASFAPAYGGYALLAELDGVQVPEPSCAAVALLVPLLASRRRGALR